MATRPEQGFTAGENVTARTGDNLRQHPIALATMPIFLLLVGMLGVDNIVSAVGPLAGPFIVVAAAFAVQGVLIAGALQYFSLLNTKKDD